MYAIHSGILATPALLVWPKTSGCSFGLLCLDSLVVPLLDQSHKKSLGAVAELPMVGEKERLIPQLTLELLWMHVSHRPVPAAWDGNHGCPFQDEQLSWCSKQTEGSEGTSRRRESRNPTQAVENQFFSIWYLWKRNIFVPVQSLQVNKGMTLTKDKIMHLLKKCVCRWMHLFYYFNLRKQIWLLFSTHPSMYPSEMLRVCVNVMPVWIMCAVCFKRLALVARLVQDL